jgi:hypothetical protein
LHGLSACLGLTYNRDVRLSFQEQTKALADYGMIVS